MMSALWPFPVWSSGDDWMPFFKLDRWLLLGWWSSALFEPLADGKDRCRPTARCVPIGVGLSPSCERLVRSSLVSIDPGSRLVLITGDELFCWLAASKVNRWIDEECDDRGTAVTENAESNDALPPEAFETVELRWAVDEEADVRRRISEFRGVFDAGVPITNGGIWVTGQQQKDRSCWQMPDSISRICSEEENRELVIGKLHFEINLSVRENKRERERKPEVNWGWKYAELLSWVSEKSVETDEWKVELSNIQSKIRHKWRWWKAQNGDEWEIEKESVIDRLVVGKNKCRGKTTEIWMRSKLERKNPYKERNSLCEVHVLFWSVILKFSVVRHFNSLLFQPQNERVNKRWR